MSNPSRKLYVYQLPDVYCQNIRLKRRARYVNLIFEVYYALKNSSFCCMHHLSNSQVNQLSLLYVASFRFQ